MFNNNNLIDFDPEIAGAMSEEVNRQRNNIELIASENIVSSAVMEAMGSALTNKYAEGYPNKRYYGGCEHVDIVEDLAIKRAKRLFNAEHVNVQSHSGASANLAVFYAFLKPGDTFLGMDLSHGGHLTHGSPVTISGTQYKVVSYGVDKLSHTIDYDNVRELALKHKPKLIIAGASAYPREIDFKAFSDIAKEAGAYLMVDMAHIAGVVAAELHMNPVLYADFVTTTTHKTLRGPRGGMILCKKEYAETIDKAVFPGTQGGPLMHIIAAKAVCFKEALEQSFKQYQINTLNNAKALANALLEKGFDIVSGGTDNHLMLVDLRNMGITGKEMAARLDEIKITCNKNSIPYDTEKPFVTSGIRLGTPAVTTRGMNEDDMKVIADIIYNVATNFSGNENKYRKAVSELVAKYPIY